MSTRYDSDEPVPVSEIAEPTGHYHVGPVSFADQVTSLVSLGLDELESRYAESGRSLTEVASPRELARRMIALVPRPSPWDDLLGPFYGPGQVAEVLGGISRQAVVERRQRRTLLGGSGIDDWSLAGWLVSPSRSLDGASPVEWLRQGRALTRLLGLGRAAARRFAQ